MATHSVGRLIVMYEIARHTGGLSFCTHLFRLSSLPTNGIIDLISRLKKKVVSWDRPPRLSEDRQRPVSMRQTIRRLRYN
jgi:hypothetical protein